MFLIYILHKKARASFLNTLRVAKTLARRMVFISDIYVDIKNPLKKNHNVKRTTRRCFFIPYI